MVHPAPRMISAPARNSTEVVRTVAGGDAVYEAAIRVENRQGKNR